jgi:hypothetical protein
MPPPALLSLSPPRRAACVGLLLAALALLYPGVTEPVLTLSGDIEKARVAELGIEFVAGNEDQAQARQMLAMISAFLGLDRIEGRIEAYRSTRSIIGLARELAAGGNGLVAVLIVTFSVLIPLLKLTLQLLALLLPPSATGPLLGANAALSKWSMADVFVLAMLIAFLAGRASEQAGELLVMQAQLERGFWFFLAYCLFSIAAGTLLLRWGMPERETASEPPAVP